MGYMAEGKPNVDTCIALSLELESLAAEAHELLQAARGRRRFDLHTRGGWLELQQSLLTERFSKHMPDESLTRLSTMCTRWLHRYRHLVYVASTRPVWNS